MRAKATTPVQPSSSFSFVPVEEGPSARDEEVVAPDPEAVYPAESRFPAMPEPETVWEASEKPDGTPAVTSVPASASAAGVPALTGEAQQILATLDELTTACELTGWQRDQVHQIILAKGLAYVLEQAAIVRSKPRNNLADALMTALRDG